MQCLINLCIWLIRSTVQRKVYYNKAGEMKIKRKSIVHGILIIYYNTGKPVNWLSPTNYLNFSGIDLNWWQLLLLYTVRSLWSIVGTLKILLQSQIWEPFLRLQKLLQHNEWRDNRYFNQCFFHVFKKNNIWFLSILH